MGLACPPDWMELSGLDESVWEDLSASCAGVSSSNSGIRDTDVEDYYKGRNFRGLESGTNRQVFRFHVSADFAFRLFQLYEAMDIQVFFTSQSIAKTTIADAYGRLNSFFRT